MKRSYLSVVVIFILAFSSFTHVNAQWEPTEGPYGGYILAMVHDGSDLYAGTYAHGIYHSASNGDVWSPFNEGLPASTSVSAIVHTNAGLTIGTFAGIFRKGPFDTSWSSLSNGIPDPSVAALAAKGDTLFAAANGLIFRSLDDGANWAASNNGLVPLDCSDCPDPQFYNTARLVMKDTTVFVGTDNGVFRSDDNGDNWYAVNQGFDGSGSLTVAALATDGNLLYAGLEGNIYRSYNNGNLWEQVPSAWPPSSILAITASGTELFVSFWGTGIYRSTDEGDNWSAFNMGFLNKVAFALELSPPLLFCGTLNGGVSRTQHDDPDWEMVNEGLVRNGVRTTCSAGADLLAGSFGTGVQILGNDGLSWSLSNTGSVDGFISSLAELGTEVFAGTANGLFHRANAGDPWTLANQGLPGVVNTLATQGDVFFAGTGNGIFRSTDGGLNWLPAGNGADLLHVRGFVALDTAVYAACFSGVYRSPDGGLNWFPMNTGLGDLSMTSVGISDGKLLAGNSSSIYRFNSLTQAWEPTNTGYANMACYAFASYQNALFAGTSVGFLISNDNGLNWFTANQGLVDTSIASLTVHGVYLYAGLWDGGVWKRQLSQLTTSVQDIKSLATDFNMQCTPNPFASTTTLRYTVPQAGVVSLKIYNMLSIEVASWSVYNSTGPQEIGWDASALPAGTYYGRMHGGGSSQTLKMLLVK